MGEQDYAGIWYITADAWKTMTGGQIDAVAIQEQLNANPMLVSALEEQISAINQMFGARFNIDGETVSWPEEEKSYPCLVSRDGDTVHLTWVDEDGDEETLTWSEGIMRWKGFQLSRERFVIKVDEAEEREVPSWVDDDLVGLVSGTFLGTQSAILSENFKASFMQKFKEKTAEIEEQLGVDPAPLHRRLEALLDDCCAEHFGRLDAETSTELLIELGEAHAKEIGAFCRSDVGALMRDALRSDELAAIRLKFTTQLAVDAGTQVQQVVTEYLSQE